MRARTFLLLLVVVAVLGLGTLLVVQGLGGNGPLGGVLGGGNDAADTTVDAVDTEDTTAEETTTDDTEEPVAEEEVVEEGDPPIELVDVVVAAVDIPAGATITLDFLTVVQRPNTNIAVRAGYSFDDPAALVGRIVGTDIVRGQEVLDAMLALSPDNLTAFGSDLATYIERGEVAVAFPIDKLSGVAYAMRPGDRVDMLMTMSFIEVDQEFQSALPNSVQPVIPGGIEDGQEFLFPPVPGGRLELIPLINQVAFVGPTEPEPVLRPVTQLTLQQVEVLWVGTWLPTEDATLVTGNQVRFEAEPDMVILGLTAQDALVLKWALEVGIDIDLVLRSQGDETVFITTSVSLPQIVEQTGVIIPDQGNLRLEPSIDEVDPPSIPEVPPSSPTGGGDGAGEEADDQQ